MRLPEEAWAGLHDGANPLTKPAAGGPKLTIPVTAIGVSVFSQATD